MGISHDDIIAAKGSGEYPLTNENAATFKGIRTVEAIKKVEKAPGIREDFVFPHNAQYNWNEDNFGPLWIPKKGVTVKLTTVNLPVYERIIDLYEDNDLQVKDGKILINGEASNEYTFKMDYYFMRGDNRHNSADSRFWGFVPEDHIVGKAVFVWLSLDKDKGWFDGKIRWRRMFRTIH